MSIGADTGIAFRPTRSPGKDQLTLNQRVKARQMQPASPLNNQSDEIIHDFGWTETLFVVAAIALLIWIILWIHVLIRRP